MTAALCASAIVGLLFSSLAAFSWRNFHFLDYGGYTNMIWNCGHGHPFKVLVDHSYLEAHLSFALALLGPAFRVWDHPLLPVVLQWICFVAGGLVLWRTMRRRTISFLLTLSVLCFYAAYPFSQSVMLSEFHGVALVFLLIPWLYHCLCFRPSALWIPLLLLCGLREDAFLAALPLLVYFAVRYRSRMSAVGAGAALAYGLTAMLVLFPLINGVSILEFRAGWLPGAQPHGGSAGTSAFTMRALATLWVLLPALPLFRRRGWIPITAFVALPLGIALFSAFPRQHGLQVHYPAVVMACLTVAIIEALSHASAHPAAAAQEPQLAGKWSSGFAFACYLVALTLFAHFHHGFLPGGGRSERVYRSIDPQGKALLAVAQQLPKKGVLLCHERLTPFCANREDLLIWEFFDPDKHTPDIVFLGSAEIVGPRGQQCARWLESGEYRKEYQDKDYLVLRRDVPSITPKIP